ncbi:MAG: CDP-alcohol phosphatidyltransferase family protein [Bradyrhizobiaceae bacterium]|nr:CDP-alcohol phosphatidyltransferase family protein [Bradyrhizobiaceae bacterium]
MNLPNLITVGRIFCVPFIVWAITVGQYQLAFWLFVIAGISDAVDGFLAKRLEAKSEFGAYLDPLADKALLMSIYVTLGIAGQVPLWLVIAVVSRDIMILGAVIVAWIVEKPIAIQPHIVSKLNTLAQILLVIVILASDAFAFDWRLISEGLVFAVAVLTGLSAAFYLAAWMRHMAA